MQKIKEYGHGVPSDLGIKGTVPLLMSSLYGPQGKRAALHCPLRTSCSFDAALTQLCSKNPNSQIACFRDTTQPANPTGQEGVLLQVGIDIFLSVFLLFLQHLNTWEGPCQEKGDCIRLNKGWMHGRISPDASPAICQIQG